MENYDQAYTETNALFGAKPEEILVRFFDRLDPTMPILDIGCGQGRNALWLAAQGFEVVALDPSEEALTQVRRASSAKGLEIRTVQGGFSDIFEGQDGVPRSFGGICVFGLLQILSPAGVEELRRAILRSTTVGSMLFLTAWTTEDPRFSAICSSWRSLGPGSFAHADGRIRTYLEANEIRRLFPDWEVVHHWEGLGPWHRHGDSPEERHGVVEFVAGRGGR